MKANGGSVLLESCLLLTLLFVAIGMNLELIRRCRIEILAHHLVFRFARGRALALSREKLRADFRHLSLRSLTVTDLGIGRRGLGVKVFHHYPTLMSFPYSAGMKRQFEVSRQCWFRY